LSAAPGRWRAQSLRARLTLGYTAALGALLVLLGVAALHLLDSGLRANVDQTLESMAETVVRVHQSAGATTAAQLEEKLGQLVGPVAAERFLQLLDPLGRPRFTPRRALALPLSATALANAEEGRETFETIPVPDGGPVRVLTWPVMQRGHLVDVVQVAMPLSTVEAARKRFLLVLLGLAPIALAGVAAGGWMLTGRALAPVDVMTATARRIGEGDLALRVPADGRDDELGRLAAVLNDMLARLERSLATARQLSADAAHELRTPLTILKGEIDVALRGTPSADEARRVLASLREEVDRLSALVEDLLFLARSDAGAMTLAAEPIDLRAVVDDAVPALHALAEQRHTTLTRTPSPEPLPIHGNPPMLLRVLLNLVDNATRHGGTGVHVTVAATRDGSSAVLTVADDGVGIAPEDQTRIFDRFYRADRARSGEGTGLGLALVRSIVELHHGTIAVDSAPGRGSRFRVRLPLAA
jgi:heavy metal sensor kinase